PVNRLILKIVFKMRDRMVLHPVPRLIFKIVFKMRARACGVLRACGVFLCGFAALRAKKYLASLSEHDFRDLKDGQDGVVSCPSFNL
ncbi:MAG: hypothetical protein ACOYOD_10285, partial [Saprospiraceae bacterium]